MGDGASQQIKKFCKNHVPPYIRGLGYNLMFDWNLLQYKTLGEN